MTLATQRLRTSFGKLPANHPFAQQVDVVFPSNPDLLEALQKVETCYWKGKVRLYNVVNDATALDSSSSSLLLVSHSRHEDDVWCIDTRSHLTICASKDTYERLGLVGRKLPFKNQTEYHLIDIPLGKNTPSPNNLDKVKSAILRWDEQRRAKSGDESWDVIYCSRDPDISPQISFPAQEEQIRKTQCKKREMDNVHIPLLSLDSPSSPYINDDPDAADDWSRYVHSIFEWVGMACLGAQRLYANDRVDPFIAVYDPPSPCRVGNITHLQWKGLLSPGFVQRIMDVIISTGIDSASASSPSFVGVTSHALTDCPVSYFPSGEVFHADPARVPLNLLKEGDDIWSLLLADSGDVSKFDGYSRG